METVYHFTLRKFESYLKCLDQKDRNGSKFVVTWRPVGDYIHLKVNVTIQESSLQVSSSLYKVYVQLYTYLYNWQVTGQTYLLLTILTGIIGKIL